MSVKHEHDDNNSTLQSTQNGLALCHRVTLAQWWVPARTPTVHQCLFGGRPWVARSNLHETTNDNKTKRKTLSQTCFQETGVVIHLESYTFCGQKTNSQDQSQNGLRHATDDKQDLISFILSCGKHCTTMQTRTVSSLFLFRRSRRLKINIRENFVHIWKSYICSNKLDVQEANFSLTQFDGI